MPATPTSPRARRSRSPRAGLSSGRRSRASRRRGTVLQGRPETTDAEGMARLRFLPHLPLLLLLAASCASSGSSDDLARSPVVLAQEAGVPLTMPPYGEVHTQWKERLAQPYIYFEHHGPREDFGATMRALLEYTVRRHVETDGPPFGLFGGDGLVRACLPVAQNPAQEGLPFAI